MKRDPNTFIFLAGFSGSGKTTVGKIVANLLGRRFFDLDRQVELSSGLSVNELIESQGERAFRRLESQRLRLLCRTVKVPAVVALGGGTLLSKSNQQLVRSHGRSMYLRCSQVELKRRLGKSRNRPLLGGTRSGISRTRIEALFDQRKSGYDKCDYWIPVTNLSAVAVARKVCEIIETTT